MNLFLVPYTGMRHLVVGLSCAGAGLLAWWLLLLVTVLAGPLWGPGADGAVFLATVGAAVSAASVLCEHALRRSPLWKRGLYPLVAGAASAGLAVLAWALWSGLLAPGLLAPLLRFCTESLGLFRTGLGEDDPQGLQALLAAMDGDAIDPSLVSLRYRLGAFVGCAVAASIGPLFVRRGRGALYHLAAGLLAGSLAAAVWHELNSELALDLYMAGAAAASVWGLCFGVFAWPLPDELYVGWLRVLSLERFGRRIPIDTPGFEQKERFIGHFPRGLDLFLPAETGTMEMHLSVAVDARHRYFARGLSLAPTVLRRFLERVNLAYDKTCPAPLETRLSSGDRVQLGQGPQAAVLEFLMLPREEQ